MRPSSLILLLLSSPGLVAQAGNTSATIFITPPASKSCPVNFSVKRSSNYGMALVKGADAPHGQGLQFDFTAAPDLVIVKAYVTVYGRSGVHMLPTLTLASSKFDAIETTVLTGNAESPLLHSSFWTKKMTGINWAELTRLEYANGTTWQASGQSHCAAAPSLFVLVDSGQPH